VDGRTTDCGVGPLSPLLLSRRPRRRFSVITLTDSGNRAIHPRGAVVSPSVRQRGERVKSRANSIAVAPLLSRNGSKQRGEP